MDASPQAAPPAPEKPRRIHPVIWQGRVGPAFWTIASVISLLVNIVLIVVLISLGKQLFQIKQVVSAQLVGGLYTNFAKMDQARIQTNIQVNSTIPVKFDLPVKTNTVVTLTENTQIEGARVSLFGGVVTIDNAYTNIILPAGSKLPIALDISVPVNTTVPVQLTVPVDIPLDKTDLHAPFVGLQQVVSPYQSLLNTGPNSWREALCPAASDWLCRWLIK